MPEHLPYFISTTILILVVPGPDFVLVTRNAWLHGRRVAMATVAGILSGLAGHTTLAVVGVSALIAANKSALIILKFLGAVYLIGLGFIGVLASLRRRGGHRVQTRQPPNESPLQPVGCGQAFAQGSLNNLLNPKAVVFFLSFLPQFVSSRAPVLPQVALLGLVVVGLAAVWWTAYVALATRSAHFLSHSQLRRRLDQFASCVLILLGIRLISARL